MEPRETYKLEELNGRQVCLSVTKENGWTFIKAEDCCTGEIYILNAIEDENGDKIV